MEILSVRDLHKCFGDKKVLRGLDLSVPENSVFGFVGRNGAGCYYRVLNGNHVYIAFNCSCMFKGADIQINAKLLPDDIYPKYNATALCNSGGRKAARCTAFIDGTIRIEWARNHDELQATEVELPWLDGFIEYFI